MALRFHKLSGAGNDFVAVDNRQAIMPPEGFARADLVRRLCARGMGVGADGVLLIELAHGDADFRMRYYNSDGGEAETCGNGARCIARFAEALGIVQGSATFETQAGLYRAEIGPEAVRVSMGAVKGLKLDIPVEVDGLFSGTVDFAHSGVPHVVVQVTDVQGVDVVGVGRAIRYNEQFAPDGANVNFIAPAGENRLDIRTYERGVEGETLACGTGSIASAVVAARRGLVEPPVVLHTRGGVDLRVHFTSDASGARGVELEGEARVVYLGQLAE